MGGDNEHKLLILPGAQQPHLQPLDQPAQPQRKLPVSFPVGQLATVDCVAAVVGVHACSCLGPLALPFPVQDFCHVAWD